MTKSICKNTCATANDGVCNDGRPSRNEDAGAEPLYRNVACDLGTDCADCGAFEFSGPEAALRWTPVADILKKNITIRTKRAVFDDLKRPSFVMAFTDPAQDVDVSRVSPVEGREHCQPSLSFLPVSLSLTHCFPPS